MGVRVVSTKNLGEPAASQNGRSVSKALRAPGMGGAQGERSVREPSAPGRLR